MKENIVNEKKMENKVKICIGLLIILIIMVCLLLGLKFFFKSNNVIKLVINNSFEKLSNSINNYSSISGNIALNFNMSGTSDDEIDKLNEIVKNVKLSVNYGIDYDKKAMAYTITPSYKNNNVFETSIYTNNSKGYIYSKELYDKYVSSGISNYSEAFDTVDKNNVKQVIEGLKSAIDVALKDSYFKTDKVTLDGSKVSKTTLLINESNYTSISNDFYNSLLANQEFLTSYSKLTDLTIDEIKTDFEKSKTEKFNKEVELSIYTNNLKFIKFELISYNNKIVISNNNDTYNVRLYLNGEETYNINFTIVKTNDTNKITIDYIDVSTGDIYTINAIYNVKYNEEVSIPSISSSVPYEELTEDELTTIMGKISNNEIVLELIQDVNATFYSNELTEMG